MDSNIGRFCVPLSVLEDGGETYENLKKTCFSAERNKMFDLMDQKNLHIMTVGIKVSGSTTGGIEESDSNRFLMKAQCALITFECSDDVNFVHHDISIVCSIQPSSNIVIENDEELTRFEDELMHADHDDKVTPDTIKLPRPIPGSVLDLSIKLVILHPAFLRTQTRSHSTIVQHKTTVITIRALPKQPKFVPLG